MKLYFSPASPFVRMVHVLLIETGLQGRVEMVPASGNALAPGSLPLAQNPVGKIPVLETPEGAIYDSRVICRYVSDLAGGAGYPSPPALWPVLVREATGHGMAEAALAMVYEARLREAAHRSGALVAAQWARVERACDLLEAADLAVPAPDVVADMGSIAVAAALGYCDFRLPDHNWRTIRPRLAAWHHEFSTRRAMAQTTPRDA